MRLTLVMPGRARQFSGGFSVLYEYARGLAGLGHTVRLVHSPYLRQDESIWNRSRRAAVYAAGRAGLIQWSPDAWIPETRGLQHRWVPRIDDSQLPDADAIVVSFAETASRVARLSAAKGRRFYLVQEYELFMTAAADEQRRMAGAFRLDFRRLAISPAVALMLAEAGAPAHASTPNGIDLDTFRLAVPIDDARRTLIAFPHRPEVFKGSAVALQAIDAARRRLGADLRVWTFGRRRPADLPADIEFHVNPPNADLAGLYNRTAIFVNPSCFEGWGLPGCESMACGAALVSTDNGGVHAYAQHATSALISPAGDAERLAANIALLVRDPGLRVALATRGQRHVQQFTWSRAVNTLAHLLEG